MEKLLLSYARDLNDAYPGYEFSIWPKALLLDYFNEALCIIAANRPDMFTELKVAPVDVCTMMVDSCNCTKVIEVLGQSDAKGRNIRPLQSRNAKANKWFGPHRHKTFTKDLTAYEILSSGSLVKVYPENVDPTHEYYVVLRCTVEPKYYTLDDEEPDTRCAFVAAARHWVLYNAKMIDGEFSQSMQAQAQEHRQMFLGILNIVDKGDPREFSDDEIKRMNLNSRVLNTGGSS